MKQLFSFLIFSLSFLMGNAQTLQYKVKFQQSSVMVIDNFNNFNTLYPVGTNSFSVALGETNDSSIYVLNANDLVIQKIAYRFVDSVLLYPAAIQVRPNWTAFKVQFNNWSNVVNVFVDSVYRKAGTDSVFFNKAGVPVFAFKDSTGSPFDTTNVYAVMATKVKYTDSSGSGHIFTTKGQADSMRARINTDLAGKQPLDADLTTIAGLTATTDNFIVSVASAWASRTPAQVKTTLSLDNVENTALSTWAGSANITTIGTVNVGTLASGAAMGKVTMSLGSDADNDMYYRSSNKLTRLPNGTAGQLLVATSGAPGWTTTMTAALSTLGLSPVSNNASDLGSSGNRYKDIYSAGVVNIRKQINIATVASDIVAIFKGTTSQTGNLSEWQNTGSTILAKVDKDGNFTATNVLSGTYTPTFTNTTNVNTSTPRQCTYCRVGNFVTVTGQLDIRLTTPASAVVMGISLPIASNFTTVYQCGGNASGIAIAGEDGGFQCNATTDVVELTFTCVTTTTRTMSFTFSYEVL